MNFIDLDSLVESWPIEWRRRATARREERKRPAGVYPPRVTPPLKC